MNLDHRHRIDLQFTFSGVRSRARFGFTLIELVMVMMVIAIVAAVVAPSLGLFNRARQIDNAASAIIEYSHYARAQAIIDGTTYRLNFDTGARTFWVTSDAGGGNFTNVTNEHGRPKSLPDGVTMQVDITSQANMLFNKTEMQQSQEQAEPENPQLIDNTQMGTTGQIMIPQRQDGDYAEFRPTGRSDSGTISLNDVLGKKVQVASTSATDDFHIVTGGK